MDTRGSEASEGGGGPSADEEGCDSESPERHRSGVAVKSFPVQHYRPAQLGSAGSGPKKVSVGHEGRIVTAISLVLLLLLLLLLHLTDYVDI